MLSFNQLPKVSIQHSKQSFIMSQIENLYQEGGVHHPDAVPIDISKHPKVDLKGISKITGWWSDEGVLGIEVEHGGVSVKGLCEQSDKAKPPHCASLKMADGEYLTEIVGQTSGKIERVTFKTSRGTSITFGNDKPDGTSFDLAHKNHKIAAISLGVSKCLYFIGAYFTPVVDASPALIPKEGNINAPELSLEEEKKWYHQYPKAIEYEKPKALPMTEHKALADPETYGRFNDFDWAIKNPVLEGKKIWIKEIMLYYSTVKKFVLGYRLKYEILDPSKATGKIIELKHVAPNPMTPTIHIHQTIDEKDFIVKVIGRKNLETDAITYLAFITNMGKCVEVGEKEGGEEFSMEGKEEKNIIAMAGKVTHALNEISIYSIK